MKRYLLLFALLALPLLADSQQPFDKNIVGLGVGLTNGTAHIVPEVDLDIRMGKPIMGFQPYSYTGFEITGANGGKGGLRLQTSAVEGVAMVRPIGEYVYAGPVIAGGIAMKDGGPVKNPNSFGIDGKFGGVLGYRFGKSQHWSAAGVFQADRSQLGDGFVPTFFLSVRLGWGK